MQNLKVVERLFPDILSGQKTATIRWREARIAPGSMLYICEGDPTKTAVVHVTRCDDMPLSKAAAWLDKSEEWPDKIMLSGMREHYPNITLDDIVQVIQHTAPIKP
ncbi:ASCH domain-containing protein [Cochlodiniinecator piscidefendens]|uniref:ASCH domain-containing protein n=1 Tax=Cochlodiniinecator piscidefendens TaxID=2715756 RepID=UPI00140B0C93|nr:ASCH domain-containing protein [Cochlodiniinecator piscidefendens]